MVSGSQLECRGQEGRHRLVGLHDCLPVHLLFDVPDFRLRVPVGAGVEVLLPVHIGLAEQDILVDVRLHHLLVRQLQGVYRLLDDVEHDVPDLVPHCDVLITAVDLDSVVVGEPLQRVARHEQLTDGLTFSVAEPGPPPVRLPARHVGLLDLGEHHHLVECQFRLEFLQRRGVQGAVVEVLGRGLQREPGDAWWVEREEEPALKVRNASADQAREWLREFRHVGLGIVLVG